MSYSHIASRSLNAADAKLVIAANEIFHDIELDRYDLEHPEIFERESSRWSRIAEALLNGPRPPKKILDIGSGTGFVAMQLKQFLRPGDTILCSDISRGMLEVCKARLTQSNLCCQLRFEKLDGNTLPKIDGGFDIVTLNSVLHHVPEPRKLIEQIDGVLAPNGTIVLGHEPNSAHSSSKTSHYLRRFVGAINYRIARPARRMRSLLSGAGGSASNPASKTHYDEIARRVSESLIASGLISTPLTIHAIWQLIDLHDNQDTVRGLPRNGGFDVKVLRTTHLRDYSLVFYETYNHLGSASSGVMSRLVERIFSAIRPNCGATFTAVFKKAVS